MMALPLPWINLLAYAANTLITYGVGVGWFGDFSDNATISRKYQSIVTPAGWAFSIWGVIFTAQLFWVLAQLQPKFKNSCPTVEAVGLNYVWVCVVQAGWTFSFAFELIPISFIFMVSILAFLWIIFKKLQPLSEHYLWKFPFYIHFGWIVAATSVNASVVLVWLKASAKVQFMAGLASLVILLLISLRVTALDYTIPGVLVWALLGIYSELNHADDNIKATFASGQVESICTGALTGATIVVAAVLAKSGASHK